MTAGLQPTVNKDEKLGKPDRVLETTWLRFRQNQTMDVPGYGVLVRMMVVIIVFSKDSCPVASKGRHDMLGFSVHVAASNWDRRDGTGFQELFI